jgi:hypothetical protein
MRALTAALVILPTMTNAEFHSGNSVYEYCKNEPHLAATYAAGVFDSVLMVEHYTSLPPVFCASEGVTTRQANDIMCNYLEKSPEDRHLTAASLAANAFHEAWPCSD